MSDTHSNGATVVVPTLREAESLPNLAAEIERSRREHQLELDVLVMDDDSRDGSREWVERHAPEGWELVTRTSQPGLSASVLDGIARARRPVVIVMDADLSHPPKLIPTMIEELAKGWEMVLGSRYVAGASTDEKWSLWRALNSRVATAMARPLTRVRDPMSGFFAFRRELVDRADRLDPIGYKIGLEILVRCSVTRVLEIPIHFSDRVQGESKLDLKEQLRYLRHLARLYRYRFL